MFYFNFRNEKSFITYSQKSYFSTFIKTKLSYLIDIAEYMYVYGFIILQFFTGIVHQIIYGNKQYPFLPLLITSIYCAFGVMYSWIRFSLIYFFEEI